MGERTAPERAWLVGGALIVALAMIAGWFLVVSPELAKAGAKRDAVAAQEQANRTLQLHVIGLRRESSQLDRLDSELRAAYTALPSAAGIDGFTRQLSDAARDSGVRLTSIAVDTPVPTVDSNTATGTGGTGGTGGTAPAVAGKTYSIGVTVISRGPTAAERDFLHAVQTGPRAALVTSAALAPPGPSDASKSAATLTIELQVFVEPQSAQDLAQLQKLLESASSD